MNADSYLKFAHIASTPWIEAHVLGSDHHPFEYLGEMVEACRAAAEREVTTASYELAAALDDCLSTVPWRRIDTLTRQRQISRHWILHRSPEWRVLQEQAAIVMAASGKALWVWEQTR